MRLGIAIWNGRVSPVLDASTRLLILNEGPDPGAPPTEVDLGHSGPLQRARAIAGLGIDTLICGAVSNGLAHLLQGAGITLIPWVAGGVPEVLEAHRRGELGDGRFLMPGCRRWRRRRGRCDGPGHRGGRSENRGRGKRERLEERSR